MDHTINVGCDLNGRKITASIPDTTEITELKYIAKVNDNNYIAENKMTVEGQTGECSVGYYHYNDAIHIFYLRNSTGVVTNLSNFTLPDDFGVVTEIDDTAVLYNYLKRNCHEKVYVLCEDFCKEESLTKNAIKDIILKNSGVPANGILAFNGEAADIPDGFVQIPDIFGSEVVNTMTGNETDKAPSVNASKNYIANAIKQEYSTEEVIVGTWKDGKPIYRKVVQTGACSLSTTATKFDAGITNVSTVIDVRFIYKYGQNDWYKFWNIKELNYNTSTNQVGIILSSSASFTDSFAIIEYTKTTD